jgi:hypothetical protein
MVRFACVALLLVSASALAPPQPANTQNRRQILGSLFGAGIVGIAAVVTPQESLHRKPVPPFRRPVLGQSSREITKIRIIRDVCVK